MIKLASRRLQTRESPRARAAEHSPLEPSPSLDDSAMTALLAAQVAAWEAEATRALLDVADDWFTEHGPDDRRYERAVRRRSLIESQLVIQSWCCWTACSQLWAVLRDMPDRESWLAEHAPEIDAATLEGIWAALMGDRLPPFGVPYPRISDQAVPAWQRGELEERRTHQRTRTAKRATKRRKAA